MNIKVDYSSSSWARVVIAPEAENHTPAALAVKAEELTSFVLADVAAKGRRLVMMEIRALVAPEGE